jgi:hypothetical protein
VLKFLQLLGRFQKFSIVINSGISDPPLFPNSDDSGYPLASIVYPLLVTVRTCYLLWLILLIETTRCCFWQCRIHSPMLADGNWFHIFLNLCFNATIFRKFSTRSHNRGEIELKQGTPEVQKYPRNWKYSANEIIRIKNWANQRRGFEKFSSGCSVIPWSAGFRGAIAFLHMWAVLRKFTSRAHQSSFYVLEVHYTCAWHSGCLICTSRVPCCSSTTNLFYFRE